MKLHFLIFWIKTGFLFLYRSGRSTIALCLMVVAAVATLIFLSSLAVGINDAMIRNSVEIYSGHVSCFSIPSSVKRESLDINGTRGSLKRVYVPGILSMGDNLETIDLVGIDPGREKDLAAIWKKNVEGRFISNGEYSVYISQPMAETLGAGIGDKLSFLTGQAVEPLALIVKGTYRTGVDNLDRKIAFCPIEILTDKSDTWSAAIFLNDGVDPNEIIQEYHKIYPSLEFMSWKELMPDLLQLIDLNYMSMSIVMFLVFGVVSLGIACAFAIFILKNLREYGIMKAMGVTPGELGYLIVIEIFLINIIASLAGIVLGLSAVLIASETGIDLTSFTSHNRYFAVSGMIIPRLTIYSLVLPPVLAMVFSLISGIWPSLLIARKKTVQILRKH